MFTSASNPSDQAPQPSAASELPSMSNFTSEHALALSEQSADGKRYVLAYRDPSLQIVCLRCQWVPHGNNVKPSLEFPTEITMGGTLRLMFDVFTTTLPRFGMVATAEMANGSTGKTLFADKSLVSKSMFWSSSHIYRGQLCGFKHRALVVIKVPHIPEELQRETYRFALSAYIFTGPKNERQTACKLYLRFLSSPFSMSSSSSALNVSCERICLDDASSACCAGSAIPSAASPCSPLGDSPFLLTPALVVPTPDRSASSKRDLECVDDGSELEPASKKARA